MDWVSEGEIGWSQQRWWARQPFSPLKVLKFCLSSGIHSWKVLLVIGILKLIFHSQFARVTVTLIFGEEPDVTVGKEFPQMLLW